MAKVIDCAFRASETKCAILTIKRCGSCSFRLTHEELKEKRIRAEERLNKRLSQGEIDAIKEKYG